jgi:hypothetical protein
MNSLIVFGVRTRTGDVVTGGDSERVITCRGQRLEEPLYGREIDSSPSPSPSIFSLCRPSFYTEPPPLPRSSQLSTNRPPTSNRVTVTEAALMSPNEECRRLTEHSQAHPHRVNIASTHHRGYSPPAGTVVTCNWLRQFGIICYLPKKKFSWYRSSNGRSCEAVGTGSARGQHYSLLRSPP